MNSVHPSPTTQSEKQMDLSQDGQLGDGCQKRIENAFESRITRVCRRLLVPK